MPKQRLTCFVQGVDDMAPQYFDSGIAGSGSRTGFRARGPGRLELRNSWAAPCSHIACRQQRR